MKGFWISLGVVFLLILGIVLLVAGGGSENAVDKPNTPKKQLVDYVNTDAEVSMRIKGKINGDEIHREVLITVSRNGRRTDIIQGYQNTVINSQSLYNNQPAFDEFLHALQIADFTKENKEPRYPSESGVCPLGRRYVFELSQAGRDIARLWTSNCNVRGSAAGKAQLIVDLFKAQIPDYDKLTAQVEL